MVAKTKCLPGMVCFDQDRFNIIAVILVIMCIGVVIYLYNDNQELLRMSSEEQMSSGDTNVFVQTEDPTVIDGIKRSASELNSMDRVKNPLRFPYKSPDLYQTADFHYDTIHGRPYTQLPFQVVGCGGRKEPCYGGTENVMPRSRYPIEVNDHNIAPVNISTRGPVGQPQMVGYVYKVSGEDNEMMPIFGRRKFPNDNKYEYYTSVGDQRVKIPLVIPHKNQELQTNDMVFLQGNGSPYTVTMYETDFPQYIPY